MKELKTEQMRFQITPSEKVRLLEYVESKHLSISAALRIIILDRLDTEDALRDASSRV